ncbi:MAG: replication restart helicase PriA, partial [Desulfatiglandales bacterium]
MIPPDKRCLRIAVTLPVDEIFLYAVPDHLVSRARVGCRVRVPFGNQKTLGYILGHDTNIRGQELKEILEVVDPEPLFHENLVPFLQWMSDYYIYPIGPFVQAAMPGGLNIRTFISGRLTKKGKEALGLPSARSEERKWLQWLGENPGKKPPFSRELVRTFQKKGWMDVETGHSKRPTRPLVRKFVRIREDAVFESFLSERIRSLSAENEEAFLRAVHERGPILLSQVSAIVPNAAYLVRKWSKKGLLEIFDKTVYRNPAGNVMFPSPVPEQLYPRQQEVLNTIEKGLHRGAFSTCLLHGVTGSGKTEVYFRAIEHAIRLGRQSILMVPEIALAVYMEGLFRSRLGERVAVYHSGLGQGERYDEWRRMAKGEVDLVIGARSAVFAPFERPGLIIVDEEHDSSYKQEEAPRYQARDVAVVRGRIEKALVILGSGTPSIQSFYNASIGRYRLLSMPCRVESRPLPDIQTVDMKKVTDVGGDEEGMISPPLREAMDSHLERGNQVILFLNRRGFDRVHLCRTCGEWVRCPNCDLALTYHLQDDRLFCHYCGYHCRPQKVCPSCRREGMRAYGFGTERLEHELKGMYPDKRIARMDRDSTRRKGLSSQILKAFSDHEVDLLVGTQMITKGYDFPNVTLVGVIAADFSLGFPDFRAGERTFQLLSQVAGRAGRGSDKGAVIVQTFNPAHYAITTAGSHDYQAFFQQEKELREQLGYPPFSYLACLRFQGNEEDKTADMAQLTGHEMMEILGRWPKRGKEIRLLGPTEAPLSKLKGRYRWQLLVKSKESGLLHYFLRVVGERSGNILRKSGVSMTIDVDPYQML